MDQDVTTVPTALAGTIAGTFYAIQNVGPARVNCRVADSAPAAGDRAFYLEPGESLEQKHPSGSNIYVWVPPGSGVTRAVPPPAAGAVGSAVFYEESS